MRELQRTLNALIALVLSGILLAAFGVQFIENERPCPLCLLQRLGMLGVGAGVLMNVRFGIKPLHYGLCILSSIFGGFVALRQISLHVCPGFPEFGIPVLGLSLYTWSFLIFTVCVLSVGVLLFLYDPERDEERLPLNGWHKTVFYLLFALSAGNVVSTAFQCGWGVCH